MFEAEQWVSAQDTLFTQAVADAWSTDGFRDPPHDSFTGHAHESPDIPGSLVSPESQALNNFTSYCP